MVNLQTCRRVPKGYILYYTCTVKLAKRMKYVVDSVFFRPFKHFIYLFFSYLYYSGRRLGGKKIWRARKRLFYCDDNAELSTEPDILFFNWINDDTRVLFKRKMFILSYRTQLPVFLLKISGEIKTVLRKTFFDLFAQSFMLWYALISYI